jgi:dTDP-4-dehydrorhamnose reductase
MHILLLGKNGQLGWELQRTLAPLGSITALDYPEIDLSEPDSIRPIVKSARPEVIVNATAYNAVDRAESEPEIAMAVNAHAPGLLAELASELQAAFVHYSTDYVFDGAKGKPYVEADAPNPLSIYGQSKLAGEQAISQVDNAYLTLRTSWVYSLRRESFVTKVLNWSRQHKVLRIVDDQVSNPTWSRMLAEISAQVLANRGENLIEWMRERRGIYHLAGDGYASRFQWAQAILEQDPAQEDQIAQDIQPARTSEFPTPAQRPLHSALNCDLFASTFGLRLPDWKDALQLAMHSDE